MRQFFLVSACFTLISFTLCSKAHSQCDYSITALNNCLPATLKLSSNSLVSKIVWKRNNVDVQTIHMSWQSTGAIIASGASIATATDLFIDPSGIMYFSIGNSTGISHCVIKWLPGELAGTVVAGGNGFGSGANQLNDPQGLFVDAAGNIYIADENNNRIQKWAPGATSGTTVAGGNGTGSALNQLASPQNVFVTSNGNIYISDFNNNRIQRWAAGAVAGVMVAGTGVAGNSENQLNQPYDIAVDAAGNMYISEFFKIKKWNNGAATGVTLIEGSSSTSQRMDMVTDGNGNVFFTYYHNNSASLRRLVAGGVSSTIIATGNPGHPSNQFGNAKGIGIDVTGRLYGLDSRVFRFDINTNLNFLVGISATYTAAITDFTGCAASSNPIFVGSTSGPTLSLTVPQTTICSGQDAVFTATSNATSPVYEWMKNGIIVGPNLNTYSSNSIADNDTIICKVTNSSTSCFKKDTVIMKVNAASNAGSLAASSNCLASLLELKTASFPSRIIWNNNNSPVDTSEVSWAQNINMIIGGQGTGTGLNQLYAPSDMQVDEAGNIYVVEAGNNRVMKFTPNTNTGVIVAGGNGAGAAANQLSNPRGIFVTSDGTIYIADNTNNRVQKWLPGAISGITINSSTYPQDIFIDKKGTIYISGDDFGTSRGRIIRISEDGLSTTIVAGGNGAGNAANQLNDPHGLYVDDQENIFIADYGNNRIQKWAKGAITGTMVAGNGTAGSAPHQLNSPTRIQVDAANIMYIADYGNRRIQKNAPGFQPVTVINNTTVPNFPNPVSFCFDKSNNIYLLSDHVYKFAATLDTRFKAVSEGTYSVTISGLSNGCYAGTNVISISNLLAPLISFNSPAVCEGNPLTINAQVTGGGINPALQWKKNGIAIINSNPSYTDLTAAPRDVYSLLVLNNQNGCYQSDTLMSTIKPLPVISLTNISTSLPASLIMSSDVVIPEIIWSHNGIPVDTTHNWKINGITVAGGNGQGSGPNQLFAPSGIWVDKAGFIFTSDHSAAQADNGTVKKWTPDIYPPISTTLLTQIGLYDLTTDSSGFLYTSQGYPNSCYIWKVDPLSYLNPALNSRYISSGGNGVHGTAPNQFYPRGLALDDSSNIYICDLQNYRIQKWAPGALAGVTVAGGNGGGLDPNQVFNPSDILLDKDRNMYIAEGTRIVKWEAGATSGITISEHPDLRPWGIFRDEQNNIYTGGINSLVKITPGVPGFMVVAGGNGPGFAANQLGSVQANIDQHAIPFLDVNGVMYIADYPNFRVQKFTSDSAKIFAAPSAGIYRFDVKGFNGCAISDSIDVYAGSYTFKGPGTDWNSAANWLNNTIPPSIIPPGYIVIIDPVNGECILNGSLTISQGANLRIASGKNLIVR